MNIKGGMDVENDMKQPTAQEELAYINQFTKSPLTAEEVYFFPVRLCDNEVDRDFERFDRATKKNAIRDNLPDVMRRERME